MVIVNTIDEKYFELNGVRYARIYQPLIQGVSAIGLYSIYDTKLQLISSVKYDQYTIDGVIYGTQALTVAFLLNAVWGGVSGSSSSADGAVYLNLAYWSGSLNDASNARLSQQDAQKIEWYINRLNTTAGVLYEIISVEIVTGVLDGVNNPNGVKVGVFKNGLPISDRSTAIVSGVTDLTADLTVTENSFVRDDTIDIEIDVYAGSNAVIGGVVQIVLKPKV